MNNLDLKAEFIFETGDQGVAAFLPVLHSGFKVSVYTGVSIKELLCEQFCISPAYLEDRVSTAFLDCQPVDDFSETILKNNALLALSTAMPGLVGATFRKSGKLAVLRGGISHDSREEIPKGTPGSVRSLGAYPAFESAPGDRCREQTRP